MTINLMRGKDIQVGDNEIKDLEKGSKVFGDVTLMAAGLFQIISSPDFIIKWDGGKFYAQMTAESLSYFLSKQNEINLFFFLQPQESMSPFTLNGATSCKVSAVTLIKIHQTIWCKIYFSFLDLKKNDDRIMTLKFCNAI